MKPLNPLAVELAGTQLVEASAGTGKTHTITTLYLRLLLEKALPPDQILVVTFTNAATAELKDRIRARLRIALAAFEGRTVEDGELAQLSAEHPQREAGAALLREALRRMDEAAVFTIHGFCQRVLAEHAFESSVPFDLELLAEEHPLLLEVVQDFWTRELEPCSDAEIQHVLHGTRFTGLLALARMTAHSRQTPIVPAPRPVRPGPLVDAYLELRERAKADWLGCRSEVKRRVLEARLNRRRYAPEQVVQAALDLDALLARSDASLEGWTPGCTRFCRSSIADGMTKQSSAPEHPFFDRMQELLEARESAHAALEQWQLGLQHRLVEFVRRELARRKEELGVQSFDDLLHQLADALRSPTGPELVARLRARHAACLVDEFQDTDPVQYEIFRKVFGGADGALFLIGDPKQAIYAFRGADVFAYLSAARDARDRAFTLVTNYRSDPSLVAATNAIFSRVDAPFLLDEIAYHPVEPRPGARDRLPRPAVELAFVPRRLTGRDDAILKDWGEAHLPGIVAAHISRLLSSNEQLDGRSIEAGDVAVLTRTNLQARQVQLALRALSIPSVMRGDESVLDSLEARDLARLLDAMADPSNASRVRAALACSLLGASAEDIDRLRDDEVLWESWMDGFSRWHEAWAKQGLVQAMRRWMRDTEAASRLLSLVDGDRRLTNLLHLVELLHQEASRRRLGIAGVLAWFEDVRFDRHKRGAIAGEAQQIRLERDDRAVQITTMHRAKGLEYPIVYCPYLWTEGGLAKRDQWLLRYHDPNDGLSLKIDLRPVTDKKDALAHADLEARAESLRLAYVALTRAKHRSIVYWGAFRQTTTPLGYLLHPPVLGGDPRTGGQKLHALDDRRLLHDLDRLVHESGGTVDIVPVDDRAGVACPPKVERGTDLRARVFSRKLVRSWRASSFSALAASSEAISVPAAEGRDVDEQGVPALPLPAPEAPERLVTLHAFPRGARAGDLVHHVLEHTDFDAAPEVLEDAARSALERQGFESAWAEPLARALGEVLTTPLTSGAASFRLADVPRSRRRSELEFVYPIHEQRSALTAGSLAAAIARHPSPKIPASYPERVARLMFEPLSGFLRGFIDLVVEHDGRFYVADYKSNHLGPSPDDYSAERLAETMAHHHYHLQYLIYSVAVHRYLSLRLPGYDYDLHFGGALYLFVRGMHPDFGAERGVFFDRPPRRLIEALSETLAGASG